MRTVYVFVSVCIYAVQLVNAIYLRGLLCKGGKEGVHKAGEIMGRWLRMVVGAGVGEDSGPTMAGPNTVGRIWW